MQRVSLQSSWLIWPCFHFLYASFLCLNFFWLALLPAHRNYSVWISCYLKTSCPRPLFSHGIFPIRSLSKTKSALLKLWVVILLFWLSPSSHDLEVHLLMVATAEADSDLHRHVIWEGLASLMNTSLVSSIVHLFKSFRRKEDIFSDCRQKIIIFSLKCEYWLF